MPWFLSDSLAEYAAAAGGMLRTHPGQNTILLAAAETLRARGTAAFGATAPLFGWWQRPDGQVSAAFLHTPPFPAALTSMSVEEAVALATVLSRRGRQLGGVNAEPAAAGAFATAWHQLTGEDVSVHMRSRLYQLGQLHPPEPMPPGQPRTAALADRGLIIAWCEAFHQEAQSGPEDVPRMVDDRLGYGGLTLWETRGQPVSLAGLTRQAASQVRVGPVYTPPGQRGQGYGGAVTWAVSRAALAAGVTSVLLFTDLANPTSNALYQRLGYRAVSDRTIFAFGKNSL
jgi:predicted GNAT family acetyltransferase